MKKIVFLVLVTFFYCAANAQKKKTTLKKATTTVLAKTANLSAEIIKDKFYLFVNNGTSKDTIVLKSIDVKNLPSDCKITAFTTKSAPLYIISWTEKTTSKTDLKTEDIINLHTAIYEITSKKLVLSNIQITKNITEKVFLGNQKDASETQQRVRREGFELTLLPDGDIILKTKTQENKMTYNAVDKKYIDLKSAITKSVVTKKKT